MDLGQVQPIILFGVALGFILICFIYLVHKINRLEKRREEDRVVERIKVIESELEQYIARSQRRLDIFKRVIDGFDHIVRNVRTLMDEEEKENVKTVYGKNNSGEIEEEKEAEVIRIDH